MSLNERESIDRSIVTVMDTRLCACVRKSHFQRHEVNVSNESRWTAWCERTWRFDFHGGTYLLCVWLVYVFAGCLYERESIVAMIDKRLCAIVVGVRYLWDEMARNDAVLMTDDWWLCYDRKLIWKILRKRFNTNENRSPFCWALRSLAFGGRNWCVGCRRPRVSDIRWRIYCRFKRYRTSLHAARRLLLVPVPVRVRKLRVLSPGRGP